MNRMPVFNSPLLLGFDHLERILEHVSKSSAEGYPPYNIEQVGDRGLRITLAVAGFTLDDLSVSLEDNQLIIRGRKKEDETARLFLHRGIATRQFQRSFVLAEGIEIVGATLDNGLLNVDLQRQAPRSQVRTIHIARGSAERKTGTTVAHTIEVTPES